MKAIGTIDSSKNFIDFEIEKPILRPHDLLIKVEAISINPVDTKVRKGIKGKTG